MAEEIIPLTLSIPLAGALLGISRPTSYRLAKAGAIPVLPMAGRKRVSVAALEEILGAKLDMARITEATKRLTHIADTAPLTLTNSPVYPDTLQVENAASASDALPFQTSHT